MYIVVYTATSFFFSNDELLRNLFLKNFSRYFFSGVIFAKILGPTTLIAEGFFVLVRIDLQNGWDSAGWENFWVSK